LVDINIRHRGLALLVDHIHHEGVTLVVLKERHMQDGQELYKNSKIIRIQVKKVVQSRSLRIL